MESQSHSSAGVQRDISPGAGGGVPVHVERGLMVTGSPRSGTTWVGRMLTMDRQLHYVHEPFNNRLRRASPNLLGAPLSPYFRHIPAGAEYPRVTRFLDYVMGRSDELERIDRSSWSEEEGVQFESIRAQKESGTKPLIKDPIAILSAEWLHLRYGVPVLIMVRHPAEFVRSMLRLEWPVGPRKFIRQREFVETLPEDLVTEIESVVPLDEPARKAAVMWKVLNLHIHQLARRHPVWMRVVRHEDLAGDPLQGFADIAKWLNMPDEALLAEIETYCSEDNPNEPEEPSSIRRNSRANRDRWRVYFGPREKRMIREITEPVSDLYGYSF